MTKQPIGRYGLVAQGFHWLTVLLLISAIPSGLRMVRIGPGPDQNFLFDLHRSMGFTILVVMTLRLLWRLTHPAPPMPAHMPRLQVFAAETVHWLLYGLLLIQALGGWIATNAFGAPIPIFGLFQLPALIAKDEPLSKILFAGHQLVGFTIIGLITLHIAAALFHTFVQKDGLLRRMWPI